MLTSKRIITVSIVTLLCAGNVAYAQKPSKKKSCISLTQTKTWIRTHKELEEDFQRLFKPDQQNRILSFEKNHVLEAIISNPDFQPLFEARYWTANNFESAKGMILALIGLLCDSKLVGLKNSADVIIWERIESKDMKFYGHGWVIGDDLFQVAGRASWLLKEITGQDFGSVKPNTSDSELKGLQERWANWYGNYGCQ